MIELRELPNGAFICDSDPGEPGTHVPRISVTPLEGRFLRFMARGCRVLEIGTGLGVSTEFLSQSARKLVTCDIDPWVKEYVWPNLPRTRSGLPPIEMVNHRSGIRAHERFDMVFIDGYHTHDQTAEDLDFALERCPRGMILVHDANLPEVMSGLGEGWSVVPTAHGIAIKYVGWFDS